MKKQRFVLDTSAFTGISRPKKEINQHISEMIFSISEAKQANITCYTPPSVWIEIVGLLQNKGIAQESIDQLDAWLVQKAPSRMELMIPAEFLYQYVGEVRERFNKGLREAESTVLSLGGNRPDPEVIKDLRERYKVRIRQGIVDSQEDLDVILLAKELEAGVVARDEGIKEWTEKWGVRFIDAEVFPKLVKQYTSKIK